MTDAPTPDQILMQLATGKWIARALGAVAALRIADAFVDGPNAVEDLAEKTGTNPDALYRTLRALATVGVFTEAPPRQFTLTPVSAQLRSDHPQSMRALVHWVTEPAGWRAWADYEHTLRTGEPSFDRELGAPGGRERTGAEFASLAARAGLRIRRFVPTASPIVVIECVAA